MYRAIERKNNIGTKVTVQRIAAVFAIVFGMLALYYCLLPALAVGTGLDTYIFFDNGLSQYDEVWYSVDSGQSWSRMNKYDDFKNNNIDVSENVNRNNTKYLYVSNQKVSEGTKVKFKGVASGTVYDTMTNYRIGDASREWGYDYENFTWESLEHSVSQAANCYFAPPKLMQYKYGGYATTSIYDKDLSSLKQYVYSYGEKKDINVDNSLTLNYSFDNGINYGTLVGSLITEPKNRVNAIIENGKLVLDGTYGVKLPLRVTGDSYAIEFKANYSVVTACTATISILNSVDGLQRWISLGYGWNTELIPGIWAREDEEIEIDIEHSDGTITTETNVNTLWTDIFSDNSFELNKEYTFRYVVDELNAKVYVDGVEVASGKVPSMNDDADIYIGVNAWDTPANCIIDNLVFEGDISSTITKIEQFIAKPESEYGLIEPHTSENRKFYNAIYDMEGKFALVNSKNDLGNDSQSIGNNTYEGSFIANGDGNNDFAEIFGYNEIKTYSATAQFFDYYSDWEMAGKPLQNHLTSYEENSVNGNRNYLGSFSEGTNRISYVYEGFIWNNAISEYYYDDNLGVKPLYFGSNSYITGNNRYYMYNSKNNLIFTDDEIANKDYAVNIGELLKTNLLDNKGNKNGVAYLIPSVREYINNEKLTGFNVDDANIAHGFSNSRGVSGLVNMVDGSLRLTGSDKQLVYFNKEYILGENNRNAVYGKVYDSVKFDFVYNPITGCYEYDSTKNNYATRLAYANGSYYMEYTTDGVRKADGDKSSETNYQFYPFNSSKADTYAEENLMFGMKLNIPFTMYIEEDKRNDSIFKFSGDDDVWVYVDDNLVMDIGGTHAAVGGIVDLKNGYAVLGSAYKDNIGEIVSSQNGEFSNSVTQSGVDVEVSEVEKAAFAIFSSNNLGIGIETSAQYLGQWILVESADFFDDKYVAIDGGHILYKYEIIENGTDGKEYLKVIVKNAAKLNEDGSKTSIKNCENKELVTSVNDSEKEVEAVCAVFELVPFELKESGEDGDIVEHNLSIYYMERGLNSSNFKLAFNFVENTERTIEKEFTDGNDKYISELDFVNVELYRTEPYNQEINYVFPSEYKFIKAVAHAIDGTSLEKTAFVRSTDTVNAEYIINNGWEFVQTNTTSSVVISINGMPLNKRVIKQLEKDAGLRLYMNDVYVSSDNIVFYDEGVTENPIYILIPCNGNSTRIRIEFTPISRSLGGTPNFDYDTWSLLDANGWIIDANAYIHNTIESYITGNGYFTDSMFSTDYPIADGEIKSFRIETYDNAVMFMAEVFNWYADQYFTTLTSANQEGLYAWWWREGPDGTNIDVYAKDGDNPTLTPGHVYDVIFVRNGNYLTIKYYDVTAKKLHLAIKGTWSYDEALADDLKIRFKSQGGSYTVKEIDIDIINNNYNDFYGEGTVSQVLSNNEEKIFWVDTSYATDTMQNPLFFVEFWHSSDKEGYLSLPVDDSLNNGGWFNGDLAISENTIISEYGDFDEIKLIPGNTYKVKISRWIDDSSGNTMIYVEYFDATLNKMLVARTSTITNVTNDLYMYFKSYGGCYSISENVDNVIVGSVDNYQGDVSIDYEIGLDEEKSFIIDSGESIDTVRLMVELYNSGAWFTSFSNGDAWFAGDDLVDIIDENYAGSDLLEPNKKYRVTVKRSSVDNSIEIVYFDLSTGVEILRIFASARNLPETMYIHFRSHGGTFIIDEECYKQINFVDNNILADSKSDMIIAPAKGNQPARTFNASDMRFIVFRHYRQYNNNVQYNNTVRVVEKTSDVMFSSGINQYSRYLILRERKWKGIMNETAYTDYRQGTFGNGVDWQYEIPGAASNDDLELVLLATANEYMDYTDVNNLYNIAEVKIIEPYIVTLYTDPVYVSKVSLNNTINWKKTWTNIVEAISVDGEAKAYKYFVKEVGVSTSDGKNINNFNQTYLDAEGNIIQPTYLYYNGIEEDFYSIDNTQGYVKIVNIPKISVNIIKEWSEKTPIELIQNIYVDIYNNFGEYVTTALIEANDLSKVSVTMDDLPKYAYIDGVWKEVKYYVKEKDISGLLPTYSTVWKRTNITLSNGSIITVYPIEEKNLVNMITITNRPVNTDEFVMWIYKMSAENHDIPIEGAVFKLEVLDKLTGQWNEVLDVNSKVSDYEGFVYLGLLDYGSYRLSEKYAPLGYAKSNIMVYFDVIIPSGDDIYGDKGDVKSLKIDNIYVEGIDNTPNDYYIWLDDSYILRVDIENEDIPLVLPETGAGGRLRLILLGLFLVLFAFTGVQLRSRKTC